MSELVSASLICVGSWCLVKLAKQVNVKIKVMHIFIDYLGRYLHVCQHYRSVCVVPVGGGKSDY